MGLAAIDFDDQALSRPVEVDLEALDQAVDYRARQPVCLEECQEVTFEVVASAIGMDSSSQDLSQRSCPPAVGISRQQLIEWSAVGEAERLGSFDCALELRRLQNGREVEKGPGGGSDRDAVLGASLVVAHG
jgi:hypothetical protein